MTIWITILILPFLILLFMRWIRKLQFDAIQNNFSVLESELGGKVIRHGFAARPGYSGQFKGKKLHISITSEGRGRERKYYLGVMMAASAAVDFVIKSADWLNHRHSQKTSINKVIELCDGQYLLETSCQATLDKLEILPVELLIKSIPDVAYILVGKTGILLEYTARDLPEATHPAQLRKCIEAMHTLRKIVEQI